MPTSMQQDIKPSTKDSPGPPIFPLYPLVLPNDSQKLLSLARSNSTLDKKQISIRPLTLLQRYILAWLRRYNQSIYLIIYLPFMKLHKEAWECLSHHTNPQPTTKKCQKEPEHATASKKPKSAAPVLKTLNFSFILVNCTACVHANKYSLPQYTSMLLFSN